MTEHYLNFFITFIPFLFAILYPNIGTVLGYMGAISGFLIIYTLPTLVHLKIMKTKITNPLLAEALAKNQFGNTPEGT